MDIDAFHQTTEMVSSWKAEPFCGGLDLAENEAAIVSKYWLKVM